MPRQQATHVDDPVAAGRRLRKAREEAGLSQRQLAFPGCSAAYISRIEAGERVASSRVLRELARRLDAREEYLARGSETHASLSLDAAEIALRLDERDEAARLFDSALSDARGNSERARALEGLGQLALRAGNAALAAELLETALSLTDDRVSERPALTEALTQAYSALNQPARAIALLERSLEGSAGDAVQQVRFAGLLGSALADNGNLDEAERMLMSALSNGRKVADPYRRARIYWSEMRRLIDLDQDEMAAGYARRAFELLQSNEDESAIARVFLRLANIHVDHGRPEEALRLLAERRELLGAAGAPVGAALEKIAEARARSQLGERETARALGLEALAALQGTTELEAGHAYATLGELFAELDQTDRARVVLEQAIDLLEQQAPRRELVRAYKRLGALLRVQGETEAALALFERALGVEGHVDALAASRSPT